jgi:vacuolar-type H+-ATPase subunit I/STV1
MGLLFLIAGLILWLVNAEWFSGQETVGIILTIVGAVMLAIQVIWFTTIATKIAKGARNF